jgi:hypothetical protein
MKNLIILIVLLLAGLNGFGQKNSLDSIFDSEQILITEHSTGCFHNITTTYLITNLQGDIQLEYSSTYKKNPQNFKLTKTDLLNLKKVFKKGLNIKKGRSYCTTTTQYKASCRDLDITFTAESCSFKKFDEWSKKYDSEN